MRIGSSAYAYLALMAGGILSLAAHSFRAGVLVGALILMLSWLYGRTGRSFAQHHSSLGPDDFHRRWRSL
jgi:hypothetical protein